MADTRGYYKVHPVTPPQSITYHCYLARLPLSYAALLFKYQLEIVRGAVMNQRSCNGLRCGSKLTPHIIWARLHIMDILNILNILNIFNINYIQAELHLLLNQLILLITNSNSLANYQITSMQAQTIHSYVRLKPQAGEHILHIEEDQSTVSVSNHNDLYQFEKAFGVKDTNRDVYESVGTGLIRSAKEGYNCCIFAYGQTSSGKTHTIKGSEEDEGLIGLALKDIYDYDRERVQIDVTINYMEIYNETINDLLNIQNTNLMIRDDGNKNIIIDKLTNFKCETLGDALGCLEKGETNRKYGSTQMNQNSSRSHCVFRIKLKVKQIHKSLRFSIINIIDLAGSESLSKTKTEGLIRKEGENINKSLLFLSNVIRGLSLKENVVNYRDSKLTRILQSSLSGNSKTSVICTVNCLAFNSAETINTLKFGVSAGQVKVKPKMNLEKKQSQLGLSRKSSESNERTDPSVDPEVIEAYELKLDKMQTSLSQLQHTVDGKTKQFRLMQMQLTLANEQTSNRDHTIRRFTSTNKNLEEENEKLNKKVKQLEEAVEKSKGETLSLRSQMMKLERENGIHLKNMEHYENSITKINKEKFEIQRSAKEEKRKYEIQRIVREEKRKSEIQRSAQEEKRKIKPPKKHPMADRTPFELESLMKHAIEILEKNKEIWFLKDRITFLQEQLKLYHTNFEVGDDKGESASNKRMREMKRNLDRSRLQDERISHMFLKFTTKIKMLEEELLSFRLTQNLNNQPGQALLESLRRGELTLQDITRDDE